MNRKGDLATTLLTFMVVVLYAVAIFSFYKSAGNVDTQIVDARFVDGVYLSEEKAKFEIRDAMEQAVATSYDGIVKTSAFAAAGDSGLKNFDAVLKTNTFDNFKSNYVMKKSGDSNNFGNFVHSMDKGVFAINVKNYPIVQREAIINEKRIYIWGFIPTWYKKQETMLGIGVMYLPNITVKVDLEKEGLTSFDKIGQALADCKGRAGNDEMKKCFEEKLPNFAVSVIDENGKKKASFESKTSFLVNGETRKIAFQLLA